MMTHRHEVIDRTGWHSGLAHPLPPPLATGLRTQSASLTYARPKGVASFPELVSILSCPSYRS